MCIIAKNKLNSKHLYRISFAIRIKSSNPVLIHSDSVFATHAVFFSPSCIFYFFSMNSSLRWLLFFFLLVLRRTSRSNGVHQQQVYHMFCLFGSITNRNEKEKKMTLWREVKIIIDPLKHTLLMANFNHKHSFFLFPDICFFFFSFTNVAN